MLGPKGLGIGCDTEAAEAGQVVGVNDLDVRYVVPEVGPPVGAAGRGDRIEGATDGSVTDGVEVALEPGRVESGNVGAEPVWIDEVDPAAIRSAGLHRRGMARASRR